MLITWSLLSKGLYATTQRRMVSITSFPLCPQWKSFQYPLDRRLNGPQSLYLRCGEEKNVTMQGIKSWLPAHSYVRNWHRIHVGFCVHIAIISGAVCFFLSMLFDLKTEAVPTFRSSVNVYPITRRHGPEESALSRIRCTHFCCSKKAIHPRNSRGSL
jgi:hypothetical protein